MSRYKSKWMGAYSKKEAVMATVLVVEDFQPLSSLYKKHLVHAGHNVLEAAGCREALEHLHVSTPDIVILDMSLPDGDGLSLASYLKQTPRFVNTQLVAATGYDQYEQLAEKHGIEYFLYKPVSVPMLLTLIERISHQLRYAAG